MKHYLTKESEQNGAILSSFYPIPIPSLPTTNQGSASIPFMEGSELTKRLMMNRQTSPGQRKSQSQKKAHPPGDDHQSTDHGQHGQASITNASMSAGQAAASTTAAAAMAQYHQHHSPPVDGSSGMDDMMELEKLNRRRKGRRVDVWTCSVSVDRIILEYTNAMGSSLTLLLQRFLSLLNFGQRRLSVETPLHVRRGRNLPQHSHCQLDARRSLLSSLPSRHLCHPHYATLLPPDAVPILSTYGKKDNHMFHQGVRYLLVCCFCFVTHTPRHLPLYSRS